MNYESLNVPFDRCKYLDKLPPRCFSVKEIFKTKRVIVDSHIH